jgi:predicted permease
MSHLKGLISRARSIVSGSSSEARMEEEFRFHVEMETQRLVQQGGLSPDEARRRAFVAFGGVDTHREAMRDGRGARWLDDLAADVRYASRGMRRAPGFAIAVAITLGLGIGVNGVVFGYVDALLFRPLPARHPERLVALFNVDGKTKQSFQVAYEDYLDFRDKSSAFDGLAAMTGTPLNLVVPWSAGAADMVWGEMVSENFFTVLDVTPAAGRFFKVDDAPQGANPFAVLSYDGWRRRFNADPSIVGKSIRINGTAFTVLGVAPEGFKGMRTFGFWPEIWVPVGMHNVVRPGSTRMLEGRGGGPFMVFGRMRPGTDRARTQRGADQFAKQLALEYPATNSTVEALVIPATIGFDDPGYVKPAVLVLASALGVFASVVTLFIICANLANLQLARAAARVHEIAIRLSLGCSRGRLVRQLLVESTMLAIPGAILAIAFLRLSGPIESSMVPRLTFRVGFGATSNARVEVFTALVALLAVVLFGLGPALRTSRVASLSGLVGAPRTSAGRRSRLRGALVVSQLALSVVLLAGATLFVRSLLLARASDIGFDPRGRALISANVGLQNYDEARGRKFYDDVATRMRALPLVVSAAWGFPVQFDTYGRGTNLYVEGVRSRSKDGTVGVSASVVSEDFVDAMGLRLEDGRAFAETDSVGAPAVMMVSRQLANRLWPGKNPIGQRARRGSASGPEILVVGVIGNAKFESLGPTSLARVYLPLRQNYRDWQTLIVHTRGDPLAAIPRLRAIVASVDPALPVFGVSTLEGGVSNGLSTARVAARIAGFFGGLALIIAAVGLYAVVAAGVNERTREIGIRVALGSSSHEVMRFVMSGGARLGLIGLVVGLGGAAVVARLMATLLYGLSPSDPVTFAIVPLALAFIVLVATYIPARRAVKLDPMMALRSD